VAIEQQTAGLKTRLAAAAQVVDWMERVTDAHYRKSLVLPTATRADPKVSYFRQSGASAWNTKQVREIHAVAHDSR